LIGAYFAAIAYAVSSLWEGREYAQSHWVNLVYKFIGKEGQAKETANIAQRHLEKSGTPANVTVRFKNDVELRRGTEFIRMNCVGCKFAKITTVQWSNGPHDFYRQPCLHPNPQVGDQYHCLSRMPIEK